MTVDNGGILVRVFIFSNRPERWNGSVQSYAWWDSVLAGQRFER